MKKKIHVKTGDTVMVISGKDKGKIIVEDINIVTKHVKPRREGEAGGIMKVPGAMYASKVMLYCSKCKKPTRIAHKVSGDSKVRVCKHCGAEL